MLNENYVYYPEQLTGEELDAFLARGWYRMGQSIFTTHFISLADHAYRVYWFRYDLQKLKPGKAVKRLTKLNAHFDITIRSFEISGELEQLYSLYKTHIDFEAAQSVQYWLHGDQVNNVFDTQLIEIRDNEVLIAAGVFDKGHESIAGILNFYHPDYKKFSLGKYLMLVKIQYALQAGKKLYYPGYIVQHYPRFDYKLFVDEQSAEIYLPEAGQWFLYKNAFADTIDNPLI
jgi:leucyl-tRNA---protein transferase